MLLSLIALSLGNFHCETRDASNAPAKVPSGARLKLLSHQGLVHSLVHERSEHCNTSREHLYIHTANQLLYQHVDCSSKHQLILVIE
jgi:hypothetical protein